MELVLYTDPERFVDEVWPWLTLKEAENCLVIGVSGGISRRPERFEGFRLWTVTDRDQILTAAFLTPPLNLVVADTDDRTAVDFLARSIHQEIGELPGVTANRPEADWFVETWTSLTGTGSEVTMAQGLFRLTQVDMPPQPPGGPRPAANTDAEQLTKWSIAFSEEAVPSDPTDPARVGQIVAMRIEEQSGAGLWVWEDAGRLVSMSGHGGPTPNGIRIAPVYTPPELRGNGYATALVAHQSQHLIDSGRKFCFLYTDLANPTSNAIYERIGYQRIADSAMIHFVGASN